MPLFSAFEAVAFVLRYQKQGVPLELDPSVTSKGSVCVFELAELEDELSHVAGHQDVVSATYDL